VILLLLVAGGLTAYVVSNLTSDDSGGGNGTAPPAANTRELPITEAQDFDPLGEGGEHGDEVQLAVDDNPGTRWQTESYSNRNFGNAKAGVGIWVELDGSHDITSVTVTALEGGWSGEIYVADQPGTSLDAWGPPRASSNDVPPTHAFPLTDAQGRYVLVWCTQLPPSYKLQIGDIKVEGR
jgi:putative peptidoglycan lipid II flippase